MAYDLHTHTVYSDGLVTPEELVKRAKQKGLTGLALTDHDTVDGLPSFLAAGKAYGLHCIPGVELSTELDGVEFHILGYQLDFCHEELRCRLKQVISARREEPDVGTLPNMVYPLPGRKLFRDVRTPLWAVSNLPGAKQKLIGPDPTKLSTIVWSPRGSLSSHRELSTLEAIALIRAADGWPVWRIRAVLVKTASFRF